MRDLVVQSFELWRHNRWPRERIMSYSLGLFRKTLLHAFRNSAFYREFYTSNGLDEGRLSNCDPQDIPIIDKDLVRDNFYRIATRPVDPAAVEKALLTGDLLTKIGDLTLVHSSGSTGKPCNFLYGPDAVTRIEANFARLSLAGRRTITFADFPVRVLYVASVGSGYSATAIALEGVEKYRARKLILNVKDPWDDWPDLIQRFKPNWVGGYPSCVRLLADLQDEGCIDIHPKKVIVGGEPLTKETRSYLEQVLGADVIDYYACTESMALGAGLPGNEGIYLFDDLNFFEVDELGRLIITPLYNNAFPLIRYRLQDVVEGFRTHQTGPLPYTHIDKVAGRSEDMMWFQQGDGKWDFLHPLFLDDLSAEGLRAYQFIQTDSTSFVLKVVKDPEAPEDLEQRLQEQVNSFLARKKLGHLSYSIEFADALPIDPTTGKVKLVLKSPTAPLSKP